MTIPVAAAVARKTGAPPLVVDELRLDEPRASEVRVRLVATAPGAEHGERRAGGHPLPAKLEGGTLVRDAQAL